MYKDKKDREKRTVSQFRVPDWKVQAKKRLRVKKAEEGPEFVHGGGGTYFMVQPSPQVISFPSSVSRVLEDYDSGIGTVSHAQKRLTALDDVAVDVVSAAMGCLFYLCKEKREADKW